MHKRVFKMSFLKKIDELHDENKITYGIKSSNNDFSSFFCVEPVGASLTKKFIVRKQKKSKLLIVSGSQRVYLADYHIISTILSMNKTYVRWFLNEFIKLYNGDYKPFKFKVINEEFEGVGINYCSKPHKILLFSDTEIDINDFIFILNFVFSKDKQWEIDSSQENFSKRTIIKYITLIDYYANRSEHSKVFLSKIGYPIDKPLQTYAFDDNVLSSEINSFDISKYL